MGLVSFLKGRIKSFPYALKGLLWLIKNQGNFQFHLIVLILVTLFGCYFSIANTEWIAVIICYGLVLMAEGFNSAIEEIVDFVSPQFSQRAGLIKDVAAASVLLSSTAAAVCGLIIFIPKFYKVVSVLANFN